MIACGAACMGQVNSNNFTSVAGGRPPDWGALILFLIVVASILAMIGYAVWEMYR
ncbi:membrane protein [Gordonia phage SpeedDemon]|uniref:Uncharacterized protein n=1 Tax=Gordonia phage Bantam TaxID=1887641 RepID=A0A1B3AYI6_9CAUD|nr:hypothetical protein BIZ77_gp056 [Gordonia phage Bantam]AOE43812.1 hypothetical protein SEA_BANTAM_123 [Gordonia phage Bantam]QNL30577.1 membrane protein [Gordonia phage SpeedDemon]